MAASKKGISAKQMQRELDLGSYRTAWFLVMRIREAMRIDAKGNPIGGAGGNLESDETYVGGKAKNAHKGKPVPKKHAVHALVERGGRVRATHVADVTAKSLRSVMEKHADKRSTLHTGRWPHGSVARQGLRGQQDGRAQCWGACSAPAGRLRRAAGRFLRRLSGYAALQ
jgi:hypothetical protein